jgi:hypothetical protein
MLNALPAEDALIYIMVVASCFLSIRRVLTADPAIVFRN